MKKYLIEKSTEKSTLFSLDTHFRPYPGLKLRPTEPNATNTLDRSTIWASKKPDAFLIYIDV